RVLDRADVVTTLHRNTQSRVFARLLLRRYGGSSGSHSTHAVPMFLDLAFLDSHDIVGEVSVQSAPSHIVIGVLKRHHCVIAFRKCNGSDRQLPLDRSWMRFPIGGHEFL